MANGFMYDSLFIQYAMRRTLSTTDDARPND